MGGNPAGASEDEYYLATRYLDEFGEMLEKLISTLLAQENINIHEITFRVKGRRSAMEKVANSPGEYAGVTELTDLLGVRIITYFPDQVDQVAKIIVREFSIDKDRSTDKRTLLDPDRFGYLSLHYLACLNASRAGLPENQVFAPLHFELQIRSILQHAWAEIEHDLGYKSGHAVPEKVRRRFSRLAGLLEIADDEFVAIRDELGTYERTIGQEIKTRPGDVGVDRISISKFIAQSSLVHELDKKIALLYKGRLDTAGDMAVSNAGRLASLLSILGVKDIEEVGRLLAEHRTVIIEFVAASVQDTAGGAPVLPQGISLLYLTYIMAFTTDDAKYRAWRQATSLDDGMIERLRAAYRGVEP